MTYPTISPEDSLGTAEATDARKLETQYLQWDHGVCACHAPLIDRIEQRQEIVTR